MEMSNTQKLTIGREGKEVPVRIGKPLVRSIGDKEPTAQFDVGEYPLKVYADITREQACALGEALHGLMENWPESKAEPEIVLSYKDLPNVHTVVVDGVKLHLVNWNDFRGFEVRPAYSGGSMSTVGPLSRIGFIRERVLNTTPWVASSYESDNPTDPVFKTVREALSYLVESAGLA